jgi:hypothetical protein
VLSFVNFYLAFLIQREYFPGVWRVREPAEYANRGRTKVPGMYARNSTRSSLQRLASRANRSIVFCSQSRITTKVSRRLQQEGVCLRSFERVQIL